MQKLMVTDLSLKDKKVLIRVDFNVPMKDGVITDDNRIVQALPTINYVIEHGGKAILFSHLGRVKSEADKAKLSLKPVGERLSVLLNKPVEFVPVTRGPLLEDAISKMKDGDVLMFENTRFEDFPGNKESGNDPELGKYWASLGDVFVNDAFGTAHRAHASNCGISANIKETAAGFLMEKEIRFIGEAVDNPVHPFIAILGGAKVSDKIGVIDNLIKKADKILIGGGMSYTFYKALGYSIGGSICEDDKVELAKELLEKGKGKIVLPVDNVVANAFNNDAEAKVVSSNSIPDGWIGVDVGPKTLALYKENLKDAKTVIWSGPVGVFEMPNFAKGTEALCTMIAELKGATTIVGGGDSASAAISMGFENKFTHISTGGGASLEYLEGKVLPGVAAITDKK